MNIKVLATTHEGYQASQEEFKLFAGKQAKVCYMTKDYEAIENAQKENIMRVMEMTKKNTHHSVFDHSKITLHLEGIPKLFAMLLNNEQCYDTNEKSGRYTKMVGHEKEDVLYQKWIPIFEKLIAEKYGTIPYFDAKRINKLAMENARYMLSVMTPTNMTHTLGFRQLNYICNWMMKLKDSDNEIYQMLVPYAEEFVKQIKALGYLDDELMDDGENRSFGLIGKRVRQEEFGENYSINYLASFASYAQEHRHRTLKYEFRLLPEKQFYVPEILLPNEELKNEWLNDIESVAENHPQGELLAVNERGSYENLIMKTKMRLCTQAQLESMRNVQNTLNRYIAETNNEEVKEILKPYANCARCVSGFNCKEPCGFKEGIDLSRTI